MIKLFFLIFFTLLYQTDFIFSSDYIDEFKARLKTEQIKFTSNNMHDIESIKAIIAIMYELDQEVRKAYMQDKNNIELKNILIEMDKSHTQTMKEILAIHGWPKISQFGQQADHQAWLLVQHADHDQAFQAQCLLILTDLYQKSETNPKNYAYLYDRVALVSQKFGMKQRYGTQYFMSDDGDISLRPYEGTCKDINAQRQEVGLSSIEEYFELIKKNT